MIYNKKNHYCDFAKNLEVFMEDKKTFNVLIIPCRKTPADDYALIANALRFSDEDEYARYLRRELQWAVVDPKNPYIEIKPPKGKGEK